MEPAETYLKWRTLREVGGAVRVRPRRALCALAGNGGGTTRPGHRSLEEVERYTRAARQSKLADAAMKKFKRRTKTVPPD